MKSESIINELLFVDCVITDVSMGEIPQDSEVFILQWWDEDYERWNGSRFSTYDEATAIRDRIVNEIDKSIRCRIIKETTKQEVVYDDKN